MNICKLYPELCTKDYFAEPIITSSAVGASGSWRTTKKLDVVRRRPDTTDTTEPMRREPPPPRDPRRGPASQRDVEDFNRLVNDIRLRGKVLANKLATEKVSESMTQHKYARLSDVAYKYSYNGKNKAEKIIKKGGEYLPDSFDKFKIVESLSGKDWTVLHNTETGENVVSFRGSDPDFYKAKVLAKNPERLLNAEDWFVNLHTMMGNPERTRRYQAAQRAVPQIARELGIEPEDLIFTGHSKGGGLARRMAEIFNTTAFTFNAADNPVKDMTYVNIGPESRVRAFRTLLDPVSVGHESKTQPNHMTVERLSAKPGTEFDFIKQHDLSQFYHDNPEIRNGQVENVRTSRARNYAGGVAGAAGMLGLTESIAPVYKDARVETKEQIFMAADLAKFGPYQGLLDPGALMLDFVDFNGIRLMPEEKQKIRKALGIKEREAPESKPPWIIKTLAKATGRYKQDQELKRMFDGTKIVESHPFVEAVEKLEKSDRDYSDWIEDTS